MVRMKWDCRLSTFSSFFLDLSLLPKHMLLSLITRCLSSRARPLKACAPQGGGCDWVHPSKTVSPPPPVFFSWWGFCCCHLGLASLIQLAVAFLDLWFTGPLPCKFCSCNVQCARSISVPQTFQRLHLSAPASIQVAYCHCFRSAARILLMLVERVCLLMSILSWPAA
jgi:hypothetical protein